METFQNMTKSTGATYQLFIRKTQIRENNQKKKGFPVQGCKMILQQSPRLNCHQNLCQKKFNIKSNSVKHDLSNTCGHDQNKCQIYQQQINKVIQTRRIVNNHSVEQQIYQGKRYKQYTQHQQEFRLVLPQQLFQKGKQKQKIVVQTQAITEPSLIEDIQPWESFHNSQAYFQ